ncbi:histidinol-phosphate transaminase [Georgenia sp. Z1344]|uniref:histidinol-phosphate transaminase n=1 Tax=Georgenia sp. Z1344 TaxID=3416706 RepID=UPI003CFB6FCE
MSSTFPPTPARPADLLRADIASLPAYVPGERPAHDRPVAKLSSNEMPFPPLPGVVEAVQAAVEDSGRYPDMAAVELTEALAGRHGVAPDQVVVGGGSTAVLETILRATCGPGDEVVAPWRSFEAYPIAVQVTGASMVRVPLDPEGRHRLDAMADAVTDRTRVILLCSPNNPTGTALTRTEVAAFLEAVPPTVLVLLDEAYIDFVTAADPTDGPSLLPAHPNLVVLRTFSKAASLAGLRVGYALGHPEIVAGIRSASTPFGVSSPAQAAALAALDADPEIRRRVAEVVAERERLVAGLRGLGLEIPETQANFVWLRLGDGAASFADAAREVDLLVRPFAGDGVRISIGTRENTDAVLALVAAQLG